MRKFRPAAIRLSATISRQPSSAQTARPASRTIETKAGDWQTTPDTISCDGKNLIKRDLASPIWRTVFHAMWIYLAYGLRRQPSRDSGEPQNWPVCDLMSYPDYVAVQ